VVVILQSFGVHSVFLLFSDFLDGTAQEDPMSVKGLILMHLGCGGYVTEFDVHSVFLQFFRHLNFNPLLFSPV